MSGIKELQWLTATTFFVIVVNVALSGLILLLTQFVANVIALRLNISRAGNFRMIRLISKLLLLS